MAIGSHQCIGKWLVPGLVFGYPSLITIEIEMVRKSVRHEGHVVSIQGYEGSFHEAAARTYFGESARVLPCATFRETVALALDATRASGGVMAIENSIAGSILMNYTLLMQHTDQLTIDGEVYLPIRQHLLANPGVKLEDIKEVHSHHMAIQQCMDYLGARPWKLVETDDTALSAKHVHQRKSKHIAAVAGSLAAKLFGLELLAKDIHTQKNNYTRFLILSRRGETVTVTDADKASVYFVTDHTKGSLAKVLSIIAGLGINLSKLQSMPIAGTHFQYGFHADLEFESPQDVRELLTEIGSGTQSFKVLGIYKNGYQGI